MIVGVVREIKPDLFLLDYHLPSMDGIELYDHLHATKGLEQIPAILLSANLPRKELEKRKMVGVRKPFELDTLLNTIAKAFDEDWQKPPSNLSKPMTAETLCVLCRG